MARSDLLLALAQAALEPNTADAVRILETVAEEESRKGHSHVAERIHGLLGTAVAASANARNRSTDSEARSVGSPRPATRQVTQSVRLSDLVLTEDAREIVSDVVNEHAHRSALRSVGLEPRHRLLFVGPPGTGKTSLASAIASELSVPLQLVQYESVIGSYLGETSSRLSDMFEEAAQAPCVLFLDEFDTLAKERGDERDAGEVKRVVSTLLLQVDHLPSHVVLLAATNHAELLDRAAWRRFQGVLHLPLPDAHQRADFASSVAKRIGAVEPNRFIETAHAMLGASFAEIEELVLTARRKEVIAAVST